MKKLSVHGGIVRGNNYQYEVWEYDDVIQLAYVNVDVKRKGIGRTLVRGLMSLAQHKNKYFCLYPDSDCGTPLFILEHFYTSCGLTKITQGEDEGMFFVDYRI